MSDFFGEDYKKATSYIIIVKQIGGEQKKSFRIFHTDEEVVEEIAEITNDIHNRIHKIMMINEDGQTAEVEVYFFDGKLRLKLKD